MCFLFSQASPAHSSSELHFDKEAAYKIHYLGDSRDTLGIQQLPDGGLVILGKETHLCFTCNIEGVREWSADGREKKNNNFKTVISGNITNAVSLFY